MYSFVSGDNIPRPAHSLADGMFIGNASAQNLRTVIADGNRCPDPFHAVQRILCFPRAVFAGHAVNPKGNGIRVMCPVAVRSTDSFLGCLMFSSAAAPFSCFFEHLPCSPGKNQNQASDQHNIHVFTPLLSGCSGNCRKHNHSRRKGIPFRFSCLS